MPEDNRIYYVHGLPVLRLSWPESYCSNCGHKMSASLTCPGCGWIDPPTTEQKPDADA